MLWDILYEICLDYILTPWIMNKNMFCAITFTLTYDSSSLTLTDIWTFKLNYIYIIIIKKKFPQGVLELSHSVASCSYFPALIWNMPGPEMTDLWRNLLTSVYENTSSELSPNSMLQPSLPLSRWNTPIWEQKPTLSCCPGGACPTPVNSTS